MLPQLPNSLPTWISFSVLLLLLGFSIVSWAIIFLKWRTIKTAQKSSLDFIDQFWKIRKLDELYDSAKRFSKSPTASLFQEAYQELIKCKRDKQDEASLATTAIDNVQHVLRRTHMTEMAQLEKLIPFLATVGSTSPFIGLFGTVVGIMNSFHQIGQQGSANLAVVAPGISEALIATAIGLVAAIPAVMAYNYFSVRLRALNNEMEGFSSDFLNVVRRHFL